MIQKTSIWRAFTGDQLIWKFGNLIPYLNQESLEKILTQNNGNTKNRLETLKFLSQLNWPTKSKHKSAAQIMFNNFRSSLESRITKEIDIKKAANIICALPYYFLHSAAQKREIQSNFYCSSDGQLLLSPVELHHSNLQSTEMLMDTTQLKISQINDIPKLPKEIFKQHIKTIVDLKLYDKCSLEQLQIVADNLPEILSERSRNEEQKYLWKLIDSGEVLEINSQPIINEDEKLIPDSDKIENSELTYQEYYEYRMSNLVYITLSSTKLNTTFQIVLASLFLLKCLFL